MNDIERHVDDNISQWNTTAMQRYLYYAVLRYAGHADILNIKITKEKVTEKGKKSSSAHL